MDWYYKAAIVVTLIWGAGRALGVYGEAARDLDLSFLIGFMLTLGGWAAVFLVIDRVARFFGWKREVPAGDLASPTEVVRSVADARGVTDDSPGPRSSRRTERRNRR